MPADSALTEVQASGRDLCRVHPCADVFPMLSDVELGALAEDIAANGLREPIVIWRAGADDSDQIISILDGRNRMEALARLGVRFRYSGLRPESRLEAEFPDGHTETVFRWCLTTDPAAYVISANIRRRHLTKEQQAELIWRAIEVTRMMLPRWQGHSVRSRPARRVQGSVAPTGHRRGEEARHLRAHDSSCAREDARVTTPRTTSPTDGSPTRGATSDPSAVETLPSALSTTAAAFSKKTQAILEG